MGNRKAGTDFKLVTWNTGRRKPAILDILSSDRADIITLQEVTHGQADPFLKTLADIGLPHAIYTGNHDEKEKRYGNVIASRWPVRSVSQGLHKPGFFWPQLIGHAAIDIGSCEVDVITAHIPNGSGNGWAKIDAFRALADVVRGAKGRPCVLTGDFNEPRYIIQNGRVVTFGQTANPPYRLWAKWSFKGRSGTGREWDERVRWFFERHDEHGLRHAFWAACAKRRVEVTHRTHGQPRWFDHAFVSDDLQITSCRYDHTVRRKGLSDHSLLDLQLATRDNITL